MPSEGNKKPRGVCWCACHKVVTEKGRNLPQPWPAYADPIAFATSCEGCRPEHAIFITKGIDPHCDVI